MGRNKQTHRFPLRLKLELYGDAQELYFGYQASLNLLFEEMIRFALNSPSFRSHIANEYARRDNSRGHFMFVRNGGY